MEETSVDGCQDFVRKFVDERKWETPPSDIVLHMTEEMGEIARAMLKFENYGGNHKKDPLDQNFGEELADMFYLLLKLSNAMKLNLLEEFNKKMDKNAKRFPAPS